MGLILHLFFGLLGTAYLVYAKKQRHILAMISGLGLCFAPYLTDNFWLLGILGAVLLGFPFVIKI